MVGWYGHPRTEIPNYNSCALRASAIETDVTVTVSHPPNRIGKFYVALMKTAARSAAKKIYVALMKIAARSAAKKSTYH